MDLRTGAVDLYRVCFILTGQQDLSMEIAADGVTEDYRNGLSREWMRGCSRKVVLAKALKAVRQELVESARRTEIARDEEPNLLRALAANEDITTTDIEEALFDIDLFPRAVLVLLVFEKIGIADAVTMLEADAGLIRKAQVIGLRGFTENVVLKKRAPSSVDTPETIKGLISC